jgi:hypothetical protein
MRLTEYPEAIAKVQRELFEVEQQVCQNQEVLNRFAARVDAMIAFDKSLTNDPQRKARRFEVLEEKAEYQKVWGALQALKVRQRNLEIDLQLLLNELEVKKLMRQTAIVRLQVQAATAA